MQESQLNINQNGKSTSTIWTRSACSLRCLSSKLRTERNVYDRKQVFRRNLETSKLKIMRQKDKKGKQTKRHKNKICPQNQPRSNHNEIRKGQQLKLKSEQNHQSPITHRSKPNARFLKKKETPIHSNKNPNSPQHISFKTITKIQTKNQTKRNFRKLSTLTKKKKTKKQRNTHR